MLRRPDVPTLGFLASTECIRLRERIQRAPMEAKWNTKMIFMMSFKMSWRKNK